jgi:hypothetical protein
VVNVIGKPDEGELHVRFAVARAGNRADDPLEGDTHSKEEKQRGPHTVYTATAPALDPTGGAE